MVDMVQSQQQFHSSSPNIRRTDNTSNQDSREVSNQLHSNSGNSFGDSDSGPPIVDPNDESTSCQPTTYEDTTHTGMPKSTAIPPSKMVTHGASGIIKPNPKFAMAATNVIIPRSPRIALNVPEWKSAMEKEFKVLRDNNTWSLISRTPTDNVINTKWVFRVKYNEEGSVERFKARPVAIGMWQIHGSDYEDTFSLVVNPLSIWLVLILVVTQD